MLERTLIAGGLLVLLVAAIALARLALRRRDRRLIVRMNAAASEAGASRPRIVYFTTRSCVVCRAQQEPALEALAGAVPELTIEQHDAVDEQALASEFSVLSVPTTAVYDRDGSLVAINRGFASAAVLHAQLDGREVQLDGGQAMTGERLEPRSSG
jgi:thiol-disulfide isomerase/thioredoxin